MNKRIKVPTLKCLRCGHEWIPNRPVEPKVCPKCKSPYWNKNKWKWKFALGDHTKANEKAPGDYEGLCGIIVERGPGKTEYGVRFDGQEETVFLNSSWLDKLV